MKVLDLYCGGGGAGAGLIRCGFEVVGIDSTLHPNYPGEFILADALHPPVRLETFDLIWASPPCQHYSWATRQYADRYPDLVRPTRKILDASGVPYVIENVPGAPVRKDLLLCGTMFNLQVIRHRHFEIKGFRVEQPRHPNHSPFEPYQCICGANSGTPPSKGRARLLRLGATWRKNDWERALDVDWMTRKELAEAIPPAYSEYIGQAFLRNHGISGGVWPHNGKNCIHTSRNLRGVREPSRSRGVP